MIEYDEGIHIKGTDLWFDSTKRALFSFLSNANVTEFVPHEKVIATPMTIKLSEKKVKNSVVLVCPFNHPFSLGKVQVELIPAGYILGSSQIVIDLDGKRIIYTGDFKLRQSETAEPAQIKRCDVVIMKCIYGLPKYVFPSPQTVIGSLIDFIDASLSSGITPILLVNVLGKAQDIAKVLGDRGYKLSLHRSIYKAVKIYEEFGISFSNYESFRPQKIEGKVLLLPPYIRGSEVIDKIAKKRIGVVMGWAVDKEFAKSAYRADEAFPISNHAGYDELLQFVEIARPKELYLIQGFSTEFARTLQKRGVKATPLEKPSQLKLI
jgi:Cft2 family RNA processing exonuclease